MNSSLRGEEKQQIVRGSDYHLFGEILFSRFHRRYPFTASVLYLINVFRLSFHISEMSHGINAGLFFYQVLNVDLIFDIGNLGDPVVPVFFLDFQKLFFQNPGKHLFRSEKLVIIFYLLL